MRQIYLGIFPGTKNIRTSDQIGSSTTFGKKYLKSKELLEKMFEGSRAIVRPDSRLARACCTIAAIVPSAAYITWAGINGDEMGGFLLFWTAAHILFSVYLMCSVYDNIRSTSKVKTVLKSLGAIWFFTMGVGILPITSDALSLLARPKAMALVLYLVVGTLICMFFAVIAIAKTDSYTDLLGRVLGFRDFIKTAELDKLNELVEEDPEYFYHIMPYAYVFGLSNKWIKNFEDLPVVAPNERRWRRKLERRWRLQWRRLQRRRCRRRRRRRLVELAAIRPKRTALASLRFNAADAKLCLRSQQSFI